MTTRSYYSVGDALIGSTPPNPDRVKVFYSNADVLITQGDPPVNINVFQSQYTNQAVQSKGYDVFQKTPVEMYSLRAEVVSPKAYPSLTQPSNSETWSVTELSIANRFYDTRVDMIHMPITSRTVAHLTVNGKDYPENVGDLIIPQRANTFIETATIVANDGSKYSPFIDPYTVSQINGSTQVRLFSELSNQAIGLYTSRPNLSQNKSEGALGLAVSIPPGTGSSLYSQGSVEQIISSTDEHEPFFPVSPMDVWSSTSSVIVSNPYGPVGVSERAIVKEYANQALVAKTDFPIAPGSLSVIDVGELVETYIKNIEYANVFPVAPIDVQTVFRTSVSSAEWAQQMPIIYPWQSSNISQNLIVKTDDEPIWKSSIDVRQFAPEFVRASEYPDVSTVLDNTIGVNVFQQSEIAVQGSSVYPTDLALPWWIDLETTENQTIIPGPVGVSVVIRFDGIENINTVSDIRQVQMVYLDSADNVEDVPAPHFRSIWRISLEETINTNTVPALGLVRVISPNSIINQNDVPAIAVMYNHDIYMLPTDNFNDLPEFLVIRTNPDEEIPEEPIVRPDTIIPIDQRAFWSENGLFRDISIDFISHPLTGAPTIVADYNSINQSLRNIFLTEKYERPFSSMNIAGRIREKLFDQSYLDNDARSDILTAIANYEPRIRVVDLSIEIQTNRMYVRLVYNIKSLERTEVFETFIERA